MHQIESTGRQASLLQYLRQNDRCQRGIFGGLEDQRAACGNCRGNLMSYQVEREVEGRDRCDNSRWFANGKAEVAFAVGYSVHRDLFTLNTLGFLGSDVKSVIGTVHFGTGELHGLACFGSNSAGDLIL